MPLPLQGPMIGILENPYLRDAFVAVKVCRCSKDVEKNGLDDFLSLAGISNDPDSHAEDQPVIAIEQNSERIVPASSHELHKLLVGELTEVTSSCTAWIIEDHTHKAGLLSLMTGCENWCGLSI